MYGKMMERSKLEQELLADVPWLNASERGEILDIYFGEEYFPSWPAIYGPQLVDEEEQYSDYEVLYNKGHIMVRNLTSVDAQGPFYGLTTDEVWMES